MVLEAKLKYPKSIFFIIINEFCERFSYYGMKTVLTLYLKNVLDFSDDTSTIIYHAFSSACYFTPILGAMLADSLLGKFKTIFYLSIVYAIGNITIALAATPPLHLPAVPFSMLGLALIALGTGGIKPCVAAFGGDQFVLPEQENYLKQFFSVFYFSINAGSLLSTFITPILRKDISCFGDETCYAASFFLPAILFIVALAIFLFGRPFYKIRTSEGNLVLRVCNCIGHALSRKKSSGIVKEHWLDHAEDKYDKKLIGDIKIVLRILFLYLPLPVFWALFDQQGSRWTIQATNMNGETFGYNVKPDQFQLVNPLLILAFIPIFDRIIYPVLGKFGLLKKPLQRLITGGILAGVAFVLSGILELQLEPTYAIVLQGNQSNLNFVNNLPCPVNLTFDKDLESRIVLPNENYLYKMIHSDNYLMSVVPEKNTSKSFCYDILPLKDYRIEAISQNASTVLIGVDSTKSLLLTMPQNPDELKKSKEGEPKIRIVSSGLDWDEVNITIYNQNDKKIFIFDGNSTDGSSKFDTVSRAGSYKVHISHSNFTDGLEIGHIRVNSGGVYVLAISRNDFSADDTSTSAYSLTLSTITEPNIIHMFWLLPQFIVITVGEVLFSISGLEFSYSEAPVSMKSLMQSAWLLTVAFGNIIVIIIAEAKFFEEQSKEFFLFAGLMFIDMIIFMVMAYNYIPAPKVESVSTMEIEENHNNEFKMSERRGSSKNDNSGVVNGGFKDYDE